MKKDVLIVEDDAVEAHYLSVFFASKDCSCDIADSVSTAKKKLENNEYRLGLFDYQLSDGTGNQILEHVSMLKKKPPVYLMSSFGTIPRAVEALKLGAKDFIEKPVDKNMLHKLVKELKNNESLKNILVPEIGPDIIYSPGSSFEEAVQTACLVANKNCHVLLNGETGTGKEVLARLIHQLSDRSNGPMISINCSAIPENLMETELFGYKKGAFTGAESDRKGKIEASHNGTLFLDEVGDMPIAIQTKMLRVLQEKSICPGGGHKDIPIDFRLICATHKNLEDMVNSGMFRNDLYYRINVIKITIPPLRKRPEDIPRFVKHFLQESAPDINADSQVKALPKSFLNYTWPGNVRQLKNTVEKYLILKEAGKTWEDILSDCEISESTSGGATRSKNALPTSKEKYSDSQILAALEKCDYHREKTSEYLGISRRSLQYRLAKINNSKGHD